MRQTAAFLSVCALLLGSCAGQQSPLRAPLPDVATVITVPETCTFIVGPALGVDVVDVLPGTASDGRLEPGDLIVAVDGAPVALRSELLSILSHRTPGDIIRITVDRRGATVDSEVVLGVDPQNPNRPRMGILVATRYRELSPETIEPMDDPGPLSRVVTVGGALFVLDPVAGTFSATDLQPLDGFSLVVAGRQYLVDRTDAASVLRDGDGRAIELSDGSIPLGIVAGTSTDLILVTTDQSGETAVLTRIEPETGRVIWSWEPSAPEAVPVFGLAAPDGSVLVVGLSIDGSEGLHYRLVDLVTGSESPDTDAVSIFDDGVVFGWFDAGRVLGQTPTTPVTLLDIDTGSVDSITLSIEPTPDTRLWPVGDGRRLLAAAGDTLVLTGTDGTVESRLIARRCEIGFVDQPGSGA